METKMEVEIIQEREIFADQAVVTHTPVEFLIDIKTILPLFDLLGDRTRTVIKHNAIRLHPAVFKDMIHAMIGNLKTYEEKYGEIKIQKGVGKNE